MLLYVTFFLSLLFASLQKLLGPQSKSYRAIVSLSGSDLPLIDSSVCAQSWCLLCSHNHCVPPNSIRSTSTQKESMRLVSEADRFLSVRFYNSDGRDIEAHFEPHCRHCLELLWSFKAIQVINGWHATSSVHQTAVPVAFAFTFVPKSFFVLEQFCFTRQTLAVEGVSVLQLRGHFDVAGWCQFSGLRGAFSSTSRYIVPKSLRTVYIQFIGVLFLMFFVCLYKRLRRSHKWVNTTWCRRVKDYDLATRK